MKITPTAPTHRFAVCICNDDYPAALELHKIYRVLPDAQGERCGMIRIVDESGDDYLYPAELFRPLNLPDSLEAELLRAS